MISLPQFTPAIWQQFSYPSNRFAHAKPRRRIERASPIKSILKGGVSRARTVVAMADDGRRQLGLFVLPRPKKRRAFRRADPLVQVSCVVSWSQLLQIER